MEFKTVCRVIGGTYYPYIELSHQCLSAELLCLELGAALVIDSSCCVRIEQVVHSEDSCELEVCPVVERVPHCIRDCLCPFFELLIAAAVTCDEFFRHTVASHRSPFVMVSSQPYLSQVLELVVVCDHFRYEMAVVVDDRHLLCTLMIKFAGEFICKHEIVVDERLAFGQAFKF